MRRKGFFLIWLWALLLLGAGYYLTLYNLEFILNANHSGIDWHWRNQRLVIDCGSWREVVNFDFQSRISRKRQ